MFSRCPKSCGTSGACRQSRVGSGRPGGSRDSSVGRPGRVSRTGTAKERPEPRLGGPIVSFCVSVARRTGEKLGSSPKFVQGNRTPRRCVVAWRWTGSLSLEYDLHEWLPDRPGYGRRGKGGGWTRPQQSGTISKLQVCRIVEKVPDQPAKRGFQPGLPRPTPPKGLRTMGKAHTGDRHRHPGRP